MADLNTYKAALEKEGIVKECKISENRNTEYISYNSGDVKPGTLFVCKGIHFNEKYLAEAVSAGAFCYVSEKKYSVDSDCIIVSDIRRAMGIMVNIYYENVWNKFNLIGITGTKGKSTTAYFVKYILDEYSASQNKPKSGIISSIDTYDGVESFESHLTTPEPFDLHRHFKNAADSGIDYVTMEVSSQALKYDRVYGVSFGVGCYLNIGEDHISDIEHPDFDDYFYSKMKIFESTETACVSLDTLRVEEVLKAAEKCKKVITFSTEDKTADIYAYDIKKVGNDTTFKVHTPKFDSEFTLTIPGLFNVQNALAAIAICYSLNIPMRDMYVGLMKARSSGRMEIYQNSDNNVIVIVDYAHNKLSFENLYKSVLKEFPGRKIYTVFGCPGYKALQRRRDLGELSGKYSDKTFITEEDAGEEPLINICRDIAENVKAAGGAYEIIEDRGEAIKQAIFEGNGKKLVLVTGKGNETRQKRGTEYVPCMTDVEYTLKYLKEYDVEKKLDASEKIGGFHDILPAFRKLYNKTIVIKLGGSALEQNEIIEDIYEDISLLKMVGARVILVHGGGKKISKALEKQGVKTEFKNGYRVTNAEVASVAESVLSGTVNKSIVEGLILNKVNAVGISGKDAGLFCAVKKKPEDIGFVGEVKSADTKLIKLLLDNDYIPVISPVGADSEGNTLNINADDAALAVAESINADTLVFVTDVDGLLLDVNNDKTIVHYMNREKAESLIDTGMIGGGMLPKLKNCVKSIENGVNEVVILNGRVKYNIVSNFITPGKIGTTIGK